MKLFGSIVGWGLGLAALAYAAFAMVVGFLFDHFEIATATRIVQAAALIAFAVAINPLAHRLAMLRSHWTRAIVALLALGIATVAHRTIVESQVTYWAISAGIGTHSLRDFSEGRVGPVGLDCPATFPSGQPWEITLQPAALGISELVPFAPMQIEVSSGDTTQSLTFDVTEHAIYAAAVLAGDSPLLREIRRTNAFAVRYNGHEYVVAVERPADRGVFESFFELCDTALSPRDRQ